MTRSGSRPSRRPSAGSWPTPSGPTPGTRATDSWARSPWHSRPTPTSSAGQCAVAGEIEADPGGPGRDPRHRRGPAHPGGGSAGGHRAALQLRHSPRRPAGVPPPRRGAPGPGGVLRLRPRLHQRHVVNGAPVRERRLTDGDELRIGSATIRFETPEGGDAACRRRSSPSSSSASSGCSTCSWPGSCGPSSGSCAERRRSPGTGPGSAAGSRAGRPTPGRCA